MIGLEVGGNFSQIINFVKINLKEPLVKAKKERNSYGVKHRDSFFP